MSVNLNQFHIEIPDAQNLVDAVDEWHKSFNNIPKEILHQDTIPSDISGYDPMHYFAIFPRLIPPSGRVLDHLYVNGVNSRPFLYWRNSQALPHSCPEDLVNEPGYRENMQSAVLEPIRSDGTAEGWLQLVLLRLKVGHTMLRWHANYQSITLLCNEQALQKQLDPSSQYVIAKPFTSQIIQSALNQDIIPKVDLNHQEVARVHITRFTMWGGYFRQTWIMQRQGPHGLRLEGEVCTVPYDCGFVF